MKFFKKVSPFNGIVVLLITVLIMLFVAVPIQNSFGMYGLAITEIIILLIGLVPIIIHKINFKDVLPVKKPKIKELFAVVLLWGGTYFVVNTISLIQVHFFPDSTNVGIEMANFFKSVPIVISLFIVAFLPAICEEVLFRGFILTTFKDVNSKMVVILCVGIMFGIFHIDIYRFFPTAVLGIVLTYIMVKTRNILLPILFHFINNFVTTLISFCVVVDKSIVVSTTTIFINIAIGLIIVPLFYFCGVKLLKCNKCSKSEVNIYDNSLSNNFSTETEYKGKFKIIFTVISILIVSMIGIVVLVQSTDTKNTTENKYDAEWFKNKQLNKNEILNLEINKKVNCYSKDIEIPFCVDSDGQYRFNCVVYNERGISSIIVIDKNNKEIMNNPSNYCKLSSGYLLDKGHYNLRIEFHLDDIDTYYKEFSPENIEKLKVNEDLTTFSNYYLKVNIFKKIQDK